MEALAALILAGVLNGLWDAKDWEPPVPEYSTSDDWYSAELTCTYYNSNDNECRSHSNGNCI